MGRHTMGRHTKAKKNKIFFTILFLVFAVGLVTCSFLLIRSKILQDKREKEMAELLLISPTPTIVEIPKKTAAPTPTEEIMPTPDALESLGIEIPEKNLDFETIQKEKNPDIYAWIYIPGTKVDYPILQHPKNDSYYLDYNVDGSKGYPGCIYTEKKNAKDFSDKNTVLYGHNMKDKSMFGSLKNFRDREYFDENRYIYVYMPDKTYVYEIFATYEYSDLHLLNDIDVSTDASYQIYLDGITNQKSMSANLVEGKELTPQDKIITLSTCVTNPSKRYLVQGVLINNEL